MSFSNAFSNGRRTLAGRTARLRSDVRDAVRGAPHDYTSGSLGRAVLILAIPDGPRAGDAVGVLRRGRLLRRPASAAAARPANSRVWHSASLTSIKLPDESAQALALGDLCLGPRHVAGCNDARYRLAGDLTGERPARAVPAGAIARAAAIRLPALAVSGYQGTGAQVPDRRQLLAQVVAGRVSSSWRSAGADMGSPLLLTAIYTVSIPPCSPHRLGHLLSRSQS